MKKILSQQFGFTIIEITVATSVFLALISITTATFLTSLKTQRHLLASINGTANIAYTLEMMSREIRMGKDFFSPTPDTINFLNFENKVIIYRLNPDTEQIERSIAGKSFQPLTSPDVRVISLRFIINGAERGDEQQVKVTIVLKIAAYAGQKQIENIIQTTVSSRQPET